VRIESNISAVINRTQRLRDQDIPAAMKRTLMPAGWLEPAYEEAKATLQRRLGGAGVSPNTVQ
jgi:hypothetical protein